jgi:hypothetical protein
MFPSRSNPLLRQLNSPGIRALVLRNQAAPRAGASGAAVLLPIGGFAVTCIY